MPDFPDASLEATKFLEDVTQFDNSDCIYILLRDTSMMGTFKNLMEAVNILAGRGWTIAQTTISNNNTMHVFMHNTHYKAKNRLPEE